MNTHAIHQAILLSKYPDKITWFTSSNASYPEGLTDLLRLCASSSKIGTFAEKNHITTDTVKNILLNYIEQVILIESNSDKRQLGLNTISDPELIALHYQLLTTIFEKHSTSNTDETLSRIESAYNRIDLLINISEKGSEYKNITLSQVPPNSLYQKKTSNTAFPSPALSYKTAFFTLSTMTIVAIALMFTFSQNPTNFKHLNDTQQTNLIIENIELNQASSQNQLPNKFTMTGLTNTVSAHKNKPLLQKVLHRLEFYYEKGLINKIKPILANSPEMKNQSDIQLQAKLETLFKITHERKMLLYNFDWKNISGQFLGEGEFLSRYKMINEKEWETRKGSAVVIAKRVNNRLEVISIELENSSIE